VRFPPQLSVLGFEFFDARAACRTPARQWGCGTRFQRGGIALAAPERQNPSESDEGIRGV